MTVVSPRRDQAAGKAVGGSNSVEQDHRREVERYALTPAQRGMLYHHVDTGGQGGTDLEQFLVRSTAPIERPTLERALTCVIAHHPILRTSFHWQDLDDPMQVVHETATMVVVDRDLTGLDAGTVALKLQSAVEEDRAEGMDLDVAPAMRCTLLHHDEGSAMLLSFHHILLDGRSAWFVLKEIFEAYDAIALGEQPSLMPHPPFRHHVDHLDAMDWEEQRAFFTARLRNISAPTPVPRDREPAAGEVIRHITTERHLDVDVVAALHELGRRTGTSISVVVQAAWSILLGRHAGQRHVVFGAIRACRHSVPDAADMVGMLINTVPVSADVGHGRRLGELLTEMGEQWRALRGAELTPPWIAQAAAKLPPGQSLFQSLVVYERYEFEQSFAPLGGSWVHRELDHYEQGSTPLSLGAYGVDTLMLQLEFSPQHQSPALASRLLEQLANLLADMARDSSEERTLGSLALLTADEKRVLERFSRGAGEADQVADATQPLGSGEATQRSTDAETSAGGAADADDIVAMIDRQVGASPKHTAIVDGDRRVTFAELGALAAAIHDRLRAKGVTPGTKVGMLLPRGVMRAAALLGIWRAGAVFVPLDADQPEARRDFICRDSGMTCVLTDGSLVGRLAASGPAQLLLGEELSAGRDAGAPKTPAAVVVRSMPAYVIYTSGSTGTPKGVVVSHGALVDRVAGLVRRYGLDARDRVPHFASIAFDVAMEEILPTWAAGGTVLMRPEPLPSSVAFFRWVRDQGVTVLQLPTAYFNEWIGGLGGASGTRQTSLRMLVIGGEQASAAALARFSDLFGREIRWVNAYGPTEAVITAVTHDGGSPEPLDQRVPVGRPLPGVRAYVVDAARELSPLYATGELLLGGAGIADGYLNQPARTAVAFIPDAYAAQPGRRAYRTGDRVRWLPGGRLDFLGRDDGQIKLRGYRIELDEIEAALRQVPGVDQAAVAIDDRVPQRKELIGYVVWSRGAGADQDADQGPSPEDSLRASLRQRLPAYMVPSRYVVLDAFPRNANDKVDRSALPLPDTVSSGGDSEPRTPTEETLAHIWADVFDRDAVGIHDNFFSLGGHSLLTLRIIDRAERAGLRIRPEDLFSYQTVAELAQRVDENASADGAAAPSDGTVLVPLRTHGHNPPLYLVHSTPGDLFGLIDLVRALGGDQPVYGLQSVGLFEPDRAQDDIVEMATTYVDAIQAQQPTGPYHLGGWCYGGIVAVEMARILEQRGAKADTIALIDAWAPRPAPHIYRYYVDRVTSLIREVSRHPLAFLGARLEMRRKAPSGDELLAFKVSTGPLKNREIVYKRNMAAVERYRPEPLAAKATVFRCADLELGLVPDHFLGWRHLIDRLVVHEVPGDHNSLLARPNVEVLARLLRQQLEGTAID